MARFMSPSTSAKGTWAYTQNMRNVFIPDVKVNLSHDQPKWFAVPTRGAAYTLAVWDSGTDKFVGYVTSEDLGYDSVKNWMKSADMTPIQKFIK